MNVLVEMLKMAAVVKGGMTNEAAESIGNDLEAMISKIDAALNASIQENATSTVWNLLDSARLADEAGEKDLADTLRADAAELVGEEDEIEEVELPVPEGAKA